MPKQKRFYTPEFKEKAVALTHTRSNVSQVCKELCLAGVKYARNEFRKIIE